MTAPSEPVRPADEETVQALAADIKAAYYRAILDRTAGAQEAARAVVASEPWQRREERIADLEQALAESEAQHRAEFERSARLMRERDEARAAVARVEALALGGIGAVWRHEVLAALRGDAEEASEPQASIGDTCCGQCPADTCYVDGVTGA